MQVTRTALTPTGSQPAKDNQECHDVPMPSAIEEQAQRDLKAAIVYAKTIDFALDRIFNPQPKKG